MDTYFLFKIKFVYEAEGENGEIEKKKMQVIAQCTCYTDAEKLANKLIERDNLNKLHCTEPEIVRMKTNVSGILLNDTVENDDTEVCGLVEIYFPNENDAWFNVKAKVGYLSDNGKTKYVIEEYLIPASNTTEAIKFLIPKLSANDYTITQTLMDTSELIYLMPYVVESKRKQ